MYKIIRAYYSGDSRVIKTNVTLAEAQAHCNNPETSSRTCVQDEALNHCLEMGPFFDGYDEM